MHLAGLARGLARLQALSDVTRCLFRYQWHFSMTVMNILAIGWEFYQELAAAIRCFSRSMLVGRVAIIVVLACIYFGLQSNLVVRERVLGLFAPGTEW